MENNAGSVNFERKGRVEPDIPKIKNIFSLIVDYNLHSWYFILEN